jgi:hypothetical protein
MPAITKRRGGRSVWLPSGGIGGLGVLGEEGVEFGGVDDVGDVGEAVVGLLFDEVDDGFGATVAVCSSSRTWMSRRILAQEAPHTPELIRLNT